MWGWVGAGDTAGRPRAVRTIQSQLSALPEAGSPLERPPGAGGGAGSGVGKPDGAGSGVAGPEGAGCRVAVDARAAVTSPVGPPLSNPGQLGPSSRAHNGRSGGASSLTSTPAFQSFIWNFIKSITSCAHHQLFGTSRQSAPGFPNPRPALCKHLGFDSSVDSGHSLA